MTASRQGRRSPPRMGTCRGPDCDRPSDRAGLCAGHRKQRQRGQELTPLDERLAPLETVIVAGSDLLEAEEDADFDRALGRMLRACERWLAGRGWRPPEVER
jgi:hypothetical protein